MSNQVKISDLKALAGQRDQQAIIAFCVERDGTLRCVTYGEDKLKCEAAGWWGQGFMSPHFTTVPFQTVFGWGNGGVPLGITPEQHSEIAHLIENGSVPAKFVNTRPEADHE